MQWEHLCSIEFCKAIVETDLCIVPMGVLERHSDHLPFGTDCFAAHRVACMAAENESAVVFPAFYFGQSNESRAHPGNISLAPAFTLQLLEQVLDEIARNGFHKILLYSWHGGNIHMIHFLAQASLWRKKNYSLYIYEMDKNLEEEIISIIGRAPCHACEWETSIMMALEPEDVHMELLPKKPAFPLNRLAHLENAYNGIWWYADFPEHYTYDASASTAEKGKRLLDAHVKALTNCVKTIKEDMISKELETEFQERAGAPYKILNI